MTKLINQSEFTQIACPGGENVGGMAAVEGLEVRGTVTLESARI
jgi:hypothetical protein